MPTHFYIHRDKEMYIEGIQIKASSAEFDYFLRILQVHVWCHYMQHNNQSSKCVILYKYLNDFEQELQYKI